MHHISETLHSIFVFAYLGLPYSGICQTPVSGLLHTLPHLRPLARLHSDGSNDESRPNLSLIGWLHLEADIEPHLEAFANVMNFTLDLLIRKYVRCFEKKKNLLPWNL